MDIDYPRPTYRNTVPARPRLQIPETISALPSKSRSAPANHPEKLILTPATNLMTATNLSPCAMPEPVIHSIYSSAARSWTYIVADPVTEQAVVIDPMLDYSRSKNMISTTSADKLLDMVLREGYSISYILETRLHKSHISASRYLQMRLSDLSQAPKICMGTSLSEHKASNRLSKDLSNKQNNGYFDHLFTDYEQFRIGNIVADVVQLPFAGAPENVAYMIGINVFTSISTTASSVSPTQSPTKVESPTSPTSTHFSVTTEQDSGDGWQRLMNLPTICRVYGGTERSAGQPCLTYEEMRALHDRTNPDSNSPVETMEAKDAITEFYATQINVRGGKIPARINLMMDGNGKGKEESEMPDPLKVPKKLAGLLC